MRCDMFTSRPYGLTRRYDIIAMHQGIYSTKRSARDGCQQRSTTSVMPYLWNGQVSILLWNHIPHCFAEIYISPMPHIYESLKGWLSNSMPPDDHRHKFDAYDCTRRPYVDLAGAGHRYFSLLPHNFKCGAIGVCTYVHRRAWSIECTVHVIVHVVR